ncbi:MAG: hypothetical protein PUE71_08155 [Clostridia bacterium]|nr:hypothetical protein [Clostridia bacterium]
MGRIRMCNKISVVMYKNRKINKNINKIVNSFEEINKILNGGYTKKCNK